jgi:hypothetical protein
MKYKTEDAVIDTKLAKENWNEATRWNGNILVSKATGSQWDHETLYQSRKGRYYIETNSQWQGRMSSAYFVSREDAAIWLLTNDHELPADLADLEHQICE